VKFVDCFFKMRGESRINISPSGSSLVKITFDNCDFFGCNQMWQGIVVDAAAATGGLKFDFLNGSVEDAYIGLTLDEQGSWGGTTVLRNTFRNNYIGISNLRKNGNSLNALIHENRFEQVAQLVSRTGIMADPELFPMYQHPLALAGIKYDQVRTTIGVPSNSPSNEFICLLNGIIGNASAIASNNNRFVDMGFAGIWTDDGSLRSIGCIFSDAGRYGILAYGTNLLVRGNQFSGAWVEGIHSEQNGKGESIRIDENNGFAINSPTWRIGISVGRPQATSGIHCAIQNNTFAVSNHSPFLRCIYVDDFFSSATDEAVISNNYVSKTSTQGSVTGIDIVIGGSDSFNVHDNNIQFGAAPNTGTTNFGIETFSIFSTSVGHKVRENQIYGASVDGSSLYCAFHIDGISGAEFCENTVNLSRRGFHFWGSNETQFRENNINNHTDGILMDAGNASICAQFGRGNRWSTNPNACDYAVRIDITGGGDPFSSRFIILEGVVLPWLPPANKISPNPSVPGQNWFYYGSIPTDYCVPVGSGGGIPPRVLTALEKGVVLGNAPLSGTALWDTKRAAYLKLKLYPELRPAGSPEAAFFNSPSLGTALIAFGQVEASVRAATGISAADQQSLDNYHSAVQQAFANLEAFDSGADYSSAANLTDAWFAQRNGLLQPTDANADAATAWELARDAQKNAALQNALAYNAAISTAQAYEASRKTANELRIRQLLRQPMTAARYQEALALAQLDAHKGGKAAKEAIAFLAPCDQARVRPRDGAAEGRHPESGDSGPSKNGLALFPNPASATVTVQLPTSAPGTLCLYNAAGQKVRSVLVEAGTEQLLLDLSNLSNGLYQALFSDEQGRSTASASLSVLR
jgi:hypothetical protein